MALTNEEMKRLAELARLEILPEESESLSVQLERILGYVGRLSAIETGGIPETEITDLIPPLRQDVPQPSDTETRKTIIQNFPDAMGDLLRVPAVFEKPKG